MAPTILFVHGLNCTGKIFTHLRSQLPEHQAIVAHYDTSQPIEKSLEQVRAEVETTDPLWIVGHSLGGIIGYLLALRNDSEFKINGLASISTPFGGSSTASILRWFFSRMDVLRDISPSSRIIEEVTTKKIKQPFISIISVDGTLPFISGDNDGIVTIESQRASLARRKVEVVANHFEVMQDCKTAATVKDFIF
jgi:pimeloyl-ACP methyl ester carboxylesterase